MPVLRNTRHERFAQLVSQGVTPTEAAKTVGYSELRAAPTGSELVRNGKIAERITELTVRVADQIVTSTAMDRVWVLQALRENYDRAMQHEAVLDHKGRETGVYVYQGNVANRALELIGKEFGMFVERKDVKITKSITELSNDELTILIADGTGADSPAESIN